MPEPQARILSKKWNSLIKRGITPPLNQAENEKRAREAHVGQ